MNITADNVNSFQNGRTSLMIAAFNNDIEEVTKELLYDVKDPNLVDEFGQSALHFANYSSSGIPKITELLISHGANVNLKDLGGKTPLFWAACNGHEGSCQLLIENGADCNARDRDGNTPFYWAKLKGQTHVCNLLREHEDSTADKKISKLRKTWQKLSF